MKNKMNRLMNNNNLLWKLKRIIYNFIISQ